LKGKEGWLQLTSFLLDLSIKTADFPLVLARVLLLVFPAQDEDGKSYEGGCIP